MGLEKTRMMLLSGC